MAAEDLRTANFIPWTFDPAAGERIVREREKANREKMAPRWPGSLDVPARGGGAWLRPLFDGMVWVHYSQIYVEPMVGEGVMRCLPRRPLCQLNSPC